MVYLRLNFSTLKVLCNHLWQWSLDSGIIFYHKRKHYTLLKYFKYLFIPTSKASFLDSTATTLNPAWAAIWAIPWPIKPYSLLFIIFVNTCWSFEYLTKPTTPTLVNLEVEVEENLRVKIRACCILYVVNDESNNDQRQLKFGMMRLM